MQDSQDLKSVALPLFTTILSLVNQESVAKNCQDVQQRIIQPFSIKMEGGNLVAAMINNLVVHKIRKQSVVNAATQKDPSKSQQTILD